VTIDSPGSELVATVFFTQIRRDAFGTRIKKISEALFFVDFPATSKQCLEGLR
jgi:hypothetical protein